MEELRKSRITQLVYSDEVSNNQVISTIDGSINPIKPISNTHGVIQALNEISNKGDWPLFVKSDDSENISVISIDRTILSNFIRGNVQSFETCSD